MRRRFKVKLEGAAEGDVFDVAINGEYLDSIEADEWGEAALRLRSRNADTEGFPMLQPGDMITVGDTELVLDLR